MIRERRSKEKLQQYYHRFIEYGTIDPNVHPWVAESWERSRTFGVACDSLRTPVRLTKPELEERRGKHRVAIDLLEGLYQAVGSYFNTYSLSLLLLDNECYALKSYALPFFQKSPGEVEGARLTEADIGTSSIAIAYEHKTPFLLFGPEMWIEEGQTGDACSAPVFLEGNLQYIVTLVSTQQGELPTGALEALLLAMKYSLENSLALQDRLEAKHALLDAVPLAAYHIKPDGKVSYANRLGQARLGVLADNLERGQLPDLNDYVLNYQHTPLYKGLKGIPSYNKEATWITPHKTYEDIATVRPLYRDNVVTGVAAVSLAIEDLKMLEAYATGYSARYSLASMVGKSPVFIAMKEKAGRAARGDHHLLLQGDTGTGKQRLAHGIHQASPRAAGPLITVKCDNVSPEILEDELYGGTAVSGEVLPGKLELAKGGTLFIDEIEKLPASLAEKLAATLSEQGAKQEAPDIRLIAACDGDLRRQVEKGRFPASLYELVAKPLIRVPSLRMRREDIPLLAEHIIQELAEQHAIPEKKLSPEAKSLLQEYEWPGNTKQLQSIIEQAFFRNPGGVIEPDGIHLPEEAGGNNSWKDDKEAFIAAWQAARGNISRLSGMLGVSRVTLYRYLKKYGLEKG